jgi:hypothetical protein
MKGNPPGVLVEPHLLLEVENIEEGDSLALNLGRRHGSSQ